MANHNAVFSIYSILIGQFFSMNTNAIDVLNPMFWLVSFQNV